MAILCAISLAVIAFVAMAALAIALDAQGDRKVVHDALDALDTRADLIRTDHTGLARRVNVIGARVEAHDRAWEAMPDDLRVTALEIPGRAPAQPAPAQTARMLDAAPLPEGSRGHGRGPPGVNPGDPIPDAPNAATEVERIERSLVALRDLAAQHPSDPATRDVVARWTRCFGRRRNAGEHPHRFDRRPRVARVLGAWHDAGLGVVAADPDAPRAPAVQEAPDRAPGATGGAGISDASTGPAGADDGETDEEATHVWTVEPGAADARDPGRPCAHQAGPDADARVWSSPLDAPPASEPRPLPLERRPAHAATLAKVDAMAAEQNVTREEMLLALAQRGLATWKRGFRRRNGQPSGADFGNARDGHGALAGER